MEKAVASLVSPSWLVTLVLASCLVAGCRGPAATSSSRLPQEAYVWQFSWTPDVSKAVAGSNAVIDGWHVLAGAVDREGHLRRIPYSATVLAATHRPVTLVFRIDADLKTADHRKLAAAIRDTVDAWSGLSVRAVEIDHDSPTSRLATYTSFLRELKLGLPGRKVAITMLPTWISDASFPALAKGVDSLVLQVHAVQNPQTGIFDPLAASAWIGQLARRTGQPFIVALPTYGARVDWGAHGEVLAVEGEGETTAGGTATEVHPSPYVVSRFVADLQDRHPAQMRGIVWFRLPTPLDKRSWRQDTWVRVMAGNVPPPSFSGRLRPVAAHPNLFDVLLTNEGDIEEAVPAEVDLSSSCSQAGGANGYFAGGARGALQLISAQGRLVAPQGERIIGWARCGTGITAGTLPNQG